MEKKYRHPSLFAEPPGNAKVERYFGYDDHDLKTIQKQYDLSVKSSYGYTWRGITRPHDRELGIVGGEQILLDLKTSEVLAVRRGFIRSGNVLNMTGIWWLKGQVCPFESRRAEFHGDEFIKKVLNPQMSKGGQNASR